MLQSMGIDPKMLGLDMPKMPAGLDPKMMLGGLDPKMFGLDPKMFGVSSHAQHSVAASGAGGKSSQTSAAHFSNTIPTSATSTTMSVPSSLTGLMDPRLLGLDPKM